MMTLKPFVIGGKDALSRLLEEVGASPDQGQQFIGDPDKLIAWIGNGCSLQTTVTVDLGRDIMEAVEAAPVDVDAEDKAYFGSNFPVTCHDKIQVDVFLVAFVPPRSFTVPAPHTTKSVTRSEVLSRLDRMGLKPAGLRVLLAFVEENPPRVPKGQENISAVGLGDAIEKEYNPKHKPGRKTDMAVEMWCRPGDEKYTLEPVPACYWSDDVHEKDNPPQQKERNYCGRFIFVAIRK